jgi:cytochrome c peroxidase
MNLKQIFTTILLLQTLSFSDVIKPIPQNVEFDHKKALLGKKMFQDVRLSKDNTISCFTCHNFYDGGDDNMPYSLGIDNQEGSINSPTVLNSRFNFVQFWDGRAKNLMEQASGPIHNPIEMGSDFPQAMAKLKKDDELVGEFLTIYKDGLTPENLLDTIVEFEKSLFTPNSRFDKYLNGDQNAISEDEKKGFEAFKDLGCISCHNGVNIGGNIFQKFGVMMNYIDKKKQIGRFNVTNDEDDKYVFKVPTLRNISKTAPYFHDGSATSLKDAVDFMIKYQLGQKVDDKQVELIVKFLYTLDGELKIVGE